MLSDLQRLPWPGEELPGLGTCEELQWLHLLLHGRRFLAQVVEIEGFEGHPVGLFNRGQVSKTYCLRLLVAYPSTRLRLFGDEGIGEPC